MPTTTETRVNDLIINKMSKAQFDALQEKSPTELYIVEGDSNAIYAEQITALPTAAAGNLGRLYQYIGATDQNYTNGYFYKCSTQTVYNATVAFEPGSESGATLSCSGSDFASFVASYTSDPTIITQVFVGYTGTDFGFMGFDSNDELIIEKYHLSLSELESAGFSFSDTPIVNDGFIGTCTITASSGGYFWQQVNVQPVPTVGDARITIRRNGYEAGYFTTNATEDQSININVPEEIQFTTMPEARAGNESQIIQYTGEPNECTVGSYVNQYGVAPALMPTFVYNAETFATFLSDRGANPNTGIDILFTSVPNDETGGMDLKITYNNGQDEYVVNLEEEFPNWSSYPPSKAEEYDEMYGALGFETNYTELCSDVEIMNTLEWMGNPDGDGCISLTLPNPSNYVNGYFYKNTPTSVKITNGSLSVLYFDGGDDEGDLPAPEPITFNVDTFNAYAASVSQPEVDHIDFYVDFETSPETGDIENILIHYNNFNDTISISVSEDSIPAFQSALASVGIGIDLTGFTRFNNLEATLPIENVYSWQQVDVQPAGSSLPDQTGQSGKFLTTDGTDASWSDKPLVNKATPASSLSILGAVNTIWNSCVAVGYNASVSGMDCVAVGYISSANSSGTAIGSMAHANGNRSIQLGREGTNNDANTFKVAVLSGNYEMMSADGTIPEARLADTTGAVQGQVLTLNANGNAEWSNPSSGGPTSVQVTLQGGSANWPSNTQSVTVQGVTTTNTIFAGAAPNSVHDYDAAGVICTAQTTNNLTFECVNVPNNDITVNVLIMA